MPFAKWIAQCLWVGSIALSIASAVLAGERVPADNYVHPQTLVDIGGGRRLNLFCMGKGSPTVVFDSGLGDGTLSWRDVQAEVAKTTRACSYDRANYGFSDSIMREATAQAAVMDLLALVDRASLGDKVVLVGHSRGGLDVRLFAYEHPERVAGLVLVDPTATERLDVHTTTAYVHKYRNYLSRGKQLLDCQHQAEDGLLKIDAPDPLRCLDEVSATDDPADVALWNEVRSLETRQSYQATLYSERKNLFYPVDEQGDSTDAMSLARARHSLGALPMVVISANWFGSAKFKGPPTAEQSEFLAWNIEQLRRMSLDSSEGRFVTVGSGHYVQKDHPDVVIDAIRHVLERIRSVPLK